MRGTDAGVIRLAIIAAVSLISPDVTHAQTSTNAGEVGIGAQIVVTTRATMPEGNPSIPTTGTGGTAGGVLGSLGVFPSRRVGLAVEFSVPLSFTDEQHAAKFAARHHHRDLLISGLLSVRSSPDRRVQVAGVGGVSLVREERRTAVAFPDQLTLELEPFGPEESTTRWTWAGTFGVDLRIVVAPHVMIVPTIRVDAIRRDDRNGEFVGLGTWSYRPGIMLRGTF